MQIRPLLLPIAAAVSVVMVTLGRFSETLAFAAALVGVASLGLVAVIPRRALLLFAFIPIASWVAQRPPWAPLLQAIVIAGAIVLVLGPLPRFDRHRDALLPFLMGTVAAVLAGTVAHYGGLLSGGGGAVSLIVVLAGFRAATVFLASSHWLYVAGLALCTLPQFGVGGLIVAAIEAAAALALMGVPAQHRVALLFGLPFAAVMLFL